MSEEKAMTLGDLREITKDLGDDVPLLVWALQQGIGVHSDYEPELCNVTKFNVVSDKGTYLIIEIA